MWIYTLGKGGLFVIALRCLSETACALIIRERLCNDVDGSIQTVSNMLWASSNNNHPDSKPVDQSSCQRSPALSVCQTKVHEFDLRLPCISKARGRSIYARMIPRASRGKNNRLHSLPGVITLMIHLHFTL